MEYIIIGLLTIAGGAFFFFRKNIFEKKDNSFRIDFDQMKFSETKKNCSI